MNDASQLAVDSATGLEINLAIAGPGARSYAFVIDWHIRLVLGFAWWTCASFVVTGSFWGEGSPDRHTYDLIVAVLPALLIFFLYHPIIEIAMHGRTPGKRMAGVRIVTREGLTPGAGALLIRNAFRIIDSLPSFYCLGLAVTFFTKESVRIGDLAAGTVLVYDRTDNRSDKDDFTADFAASRAHPHLAEIIDDLLARWPSLERNTRVDLAQKLLARFDPSYRQTEDEKELQAKLRALLKT